MTATSIDTCFEVTVNGTVCRFDEEQSGDLLVHFLRDHLGHTDVKLACGEGACSACCVLVDGESIPSCMIMLGRVRGRTVRTPADLATDPVGHQIAESLCDQGGLQCGFCTPGILTSVYGLAVRREAAGQSGAESVPPLAASITQAMGGHICRCTGYRGILAATHAALEALAAAPTERPGPEG